MATRPCMSLGAGMSTSLSQAGLRMCHLVHAQFSDASAHVRMSLRGTLKPASMHVSEGGAGGHPVDACSSEGGSSLREALTPADVHSSAEGAANQPLHQRSRCWNPSTPLKVGQPSPPSEEHRGPGDVLGECQIPLVRNSRSASTWCAPHQSHPPGNAPALNSSTSTWDEDLC